MTEQNTRTKVSVSDPNFEDVEGPMDVSEPVVDEKVLARKARKAAQDKARRAAKKGKPLVEVLTETPEEKPDPRIIWPTRPVQGTCASAVSWHTWQSKCGRFQVARIVARQGQPSGFSCQFRPASQDSWELIAHTKQGPTYTRLFKTLRECLEATEIFAVGKLGYGSFNLEQCLSEAEKQGMADVPSTITESKSSRRVSEEVSIIEVPDYVREETIVKISKTKAVELLKAIGLPSANGKQPVKVLSKNVSTLSKLNGVKEIQLEDDDLQTLLADVLADLGAGKKVEVVEDSPAKGGKGKPAANPSKNGKAASNGRAEVDRFGMRGAHSCAINAVLGAKPLSTETIAQKSGLPVNRVKSHLKFWKKQDKGLGTCLIESDKGWSVDLAKLSK